ncbi:hypothetical protein F909_04029 [Acinetobacter sp. ANC 3929]|uniref:hypothetical protein n=1 Tax=unclassified Acinetobacter TaxID=196816 RepID=UPI0002D0E710|nr:MULTISPECIES: hypothetical protein [unclassified Acinetobacter]ENW78340.1 hypothetical protein F909_04029 [Acinetobacter sp. ANC 3929]MCH7353876.1 hypothetical protein [Acinetobacter sp. NIPH 2023]MCH7355481.1 hypothetical protein [Acinetobacter sp. NIPH 1958]MCH7361195.1 hypothetical protein [Acinetobacter sp. NIPH 2024]
MFTKIRQKTILAFLFTISLNHTNAMDSMTDKELSEETGQALFSIQTIAPDSNGNPNQNIGFYRLAMQVEMESNLNIKSLQLGCGGVKGAGCDIDLSNVSLTGVNPIDNNFASTDAKIKNPFFEFAIKHPNSAALREIVGLRLGAESVLGLLSLGSNPDSENILDDTGIGTITGDLNISVTDSKLSNGCVRLLVCLPFTGTLAPYNTSISVNRAKTIDLTGLQATTTSVVGFPIGLTLNNINVLNQPLSTVHRLLLAKDKDGNIPTSDFYLSLQSMPITWQKLSSQSFDNPQAQSGWWISLPNLQISNLDIKQQVEVAASDVIGGILFNQPIYINPLDLGQKHAQNCYGSLKFC